MPTLEIDSSNDDQKLLGVGPEIRTKGKVIFSGRAEVDLKVVFDTTGSMSDKIVALTQMVSDLIEEAATMALDIRYSLISFGDLTIRGDKIVVEEPGTTDPARMVSALHNKHKNSGGGNDGESSFEAVMEALNIQPRSKDAVQIMVLITDEPALFDHYQPGNILEKLRSSAMICFVLSPRFEYYKRMAEDNAGVWKEISRDVKLQELKDALAQLVKDVAIMIRDLKRLAHGNPARLKQLKSGKD